MFDDIIEIVEDDDYKVTINYETMTTTFEVNSFIDLASDVSEILKEVS